MSCVDHIPVAHTLAGGHDGFPAAILGGCADALVDGAPDLQEDRGPELAFIIDGFVAGALE